MKRFEYRGRVPGGETVAGVLRAGDSEKLRDELLGRSIVLESYQETLSRSELLTIKITGGSDITRSTRQLATLLESGLAADEAIDSLIEDGEGGKTAVVFQSVLEGLREGSTLADAFGRFPGLFDSTYVALVEAGERSGSLPEMLDRLASHREQMEDLRRKFLTSLTYPALVVVVSIAVLIAVFTFVIPVFQEMYASFGAEMPAMTRVVVDFSHTLRDDYPIILFVLLALTTALTLCFQSNWGRMLIHSTALRIPMFGSIWKKVAISRFSRTLGLLHREGSDLLTALRISRRVLGNCKLESRLESAESSLSAGVSLRETLKESGIFPRTLLRMIGSGEKSGKLGAMLLNSARYLDKEIEASLSMITSVIEPVIILILGSIVGFVIVVMYLPLFDLINQIGP